jgi:hypothetical protein
VKETAVKTGFFITKNKWQAIIYLFSFIFIALILYMAAEDQNVRAAETIKNTAQVDSHNPVNRLFLGQEQEHFAQHQVIEKSAALDDAIRRYRIEQNLIRSNKISRGIEKSHEIQMNKKTAIIENKFRDPGYIIDLSIRQLNLPGQKDKHTGDNKLRTSSLQKKNSGSINGRITSANGMALTGQLVNVFDKYGYFISSGYSDLEGYYHVADMSPGLYYVRAGGQGDIYIRQYYNQVNDLRDATLVEVTAGGNTEHIDFSLKVGGTVSGRVMDRYSKPLEYRGHIYALETKTGYVANEAENDENGIYHISGLPAGSYFIRTETYNNYCDKYYNDVNSIKDAVPVFVTIPDTTFGINFKLSPAGEIHGFVTNEQGAPISDFDILVLDPITAEILKIKSCGGGDYGIAGLATGQYILRTFCWDLHGYKDEFYDNVTNFNNATPVHVQAPQSTDGINFVLQSLKGGIAGRVRDNNGYPVFGIRIQAVQQENGESHWGETDEFGDYLIDGLSSGNYFVKTDAYELDYINKIFRDEENFLSATPVEVVEPLVTEGIDFTLENKNGMISGRITNDLGEPLKWVKPRIYSLAWQEFINDDIRDASDENGEYLIWSLIPGDYLVLAANYGGEYADEYYDDKSEFSLATPVHVAASQITKNIDFALSRGGAISGTVVDEFHQPVDSITLMALGHKTGDFRNLAYTDGMGHYVINGLTTGDYVVKVEGRYYGYADGYYDSSRLFKDAIPVHVNAPENKKGIDFTLKPDGSINGMVTDYSGQPVIQGYITALDAETGEFIGSSEPDNHGRYSINGLATGDYVVRIDAQYLGFTKVFYGNSGNFTGAAHVHVTAPEATDNINFVLEKGGGISGHVYDMAAAIAFNSAVLAIEPDLLEVVSEVQVKHDGTYSIEGLAEGQYLVKTSTYGIDYVDEYFNNTTDLSAAEPVMVNPPETVNGIDFQLATTGGYISGRVVDSNGFPVSCSIIAMNTQTLAPDGYGRTGNDGYYSIDRLVPGEYYVMTETYGEFVNEYFNNALTPAQAVKVIVSANDTTSAIDFVLDRLSGTITGRITDNHDKAIADMWVMALNRTNNDFYREGYTLDNGEYVINGLLGGDYAVYCLGAQQGYVNQFYQSVLDISQARNVTVTPPGTSTGIDFILQKGDTLSGWITRDNSPIDADTMDVTVLAFDAQSGFYRGSQSVGINGGFRISALPPGTFKVAALPQYHGTSYEFRTTWFGGGSHFNDPASAQIELEHAQPHADISIELEKGHSMISGKVFDRFTGGPAIFSNDDAVIITYDATGHIAAISTVGANPANFSHLDAGEYKIWSLAGGDYYLLLISRDQAFKDWWYPDIAADISPLSWELGTIAVAAIDSMDKVTLPDSTELDGIDFSLVKTGIQSPAREPSVRIDRFDLAQNYPNPFNSETAIQYQLPESAWIKIVIYNMMGQPVKVLINKRNEPGSYAVAWNGLDENGKAVASGLYFCSLQTKQYSYVRKMILLR